MFPSLDDRLESEHLLTTLSCLVSSIYAALGSARCYCTQATEACLPVQVLSSHTAIQVSSSLSQPHADNSWPTLSCLKSFRLSAQRPQLSPAQ